VSIGQCLNIAARFYRSAMTQSTEIHTLPRRSSIDYSRQSGFVWVWRAVGPTFLLSAICTADAFSRDIDLYAYAHIIEATDGLRGFQRPTSAGLRKARPSPIWTPVGPLALHKAVYNRIVRIIAGGGPWRCA